METDWSKLEHAYGPADDIPEILAKLDPDPHAAVWEDLWSRVWHQGDTYSASLPVLPSLWEKVSTWPPDRRSAAIMLAGAIVTARKSGFEGYEGVIEDFRRASAEMLGNRELEREERVYLLASMLAFEGDTFWSGNLECLCGGDLLGLCPGCGGRVYLWIGADGFSCGREWNIITRDRTDIHPKPPPQLKGLGKRLFDIAMDAEDDGLAGWICYLFGTSTCPECGKTFAVPDAIAKAHA